MTPLRAPFRPDASTRAFSLVEVVIALGICSFVLVTLIGLYGIGIHVNRQSEAQVQAGNLASLIISSRNAAPTNASAFPNLCIPVAALSNAYTNAFPGNTATHFIGADGMLTNSAANAAYIATCLAGTNAITGPNVAQVYLMLSWPAVVSQANSAASDHYEVTTYIPLH